MHCEYNVCLVPKTAAAADQNIIRICQALNISVSQEVIYDLLTQTLVVYHLTCVRQAISDIHSIVKEPAPPLHKALIMMYNHRWSFCVNKWQIGLTDHGRRPKHSV